MKNGMTEQRRVAVVVGGGPAGLMAAQKLCDAGFSVDLFEQKGSVGRKFLLAGKGGLNLSHSEDHAAFVSRYRDRAEIVSRWLEDFSVVDLRAWAAGLGVETIIGSSGRIFPQDLKAAPLLRGWVRRLRSQGVRFHVGHCLTQWRQTTDGAFTLQIDHSAGSKDVRTDCLILALGGGSWPQLGSDGKWEQWIAQQGVAVAPLQAANCGFEINWSSHLSERFSGAAIKPVSMSWRDRHGQTHQQRGEFILTAHGVEGGLIYAASADLREQISIAGQAEVTLDLLPEHEVEAISNVLQADRKGRSLSEVLRRQFRLDGARAALIFETSGTGLRNEPARLAAHIKGLPLVLERTRPLVEAISSAGGVSLSGLSDGLMSISNPGIFFAGEMLDWEAPTGGYLLTACLASGAVAAGSAVSWLNARPAMLDARTQ